MTEKKLTLAEVCERLNKRRGAVAYVQRLRREAQAVKRTYGQPRNPFAAVPGMEAEFKEADRVARYCDFILNEIEKKPRRKRELSGFFNAVARRLLDYLIILGLLTFAAFGISLMVWSMAAALGLLLGVSLPRWVVALVILALVALVAAGVELWKKPKPPIKRTAPYKPEDIVIERRMQAERAASGDKAGVSSYTAGEFTRQRDEKGLPHERTVPYRPEDIVIERRRQGL